MAYNSFISLLKMHFKIKRLLDIDMPYYKYDNLFSQDN
jgi:hypothetical protein